MKVLHSRLLSNEIDFTSWAFIVLFQGGECMNIQEQNKKSRCSDDHIKITGWEIVDINRKLNIFNFLLIILILLQVFQLFL